MMKLYNFYILKYIIMSEYVIKLLIVYPDTNTCPSFIHVLVIMTEKKIYRILGFWRIKFK